MNPARQLLAAQAIRDRLAPPHPAAWIALSDDEACQRARAFRLATHRVTDLTFGREVAS